MHRILLCLSMFMPLMAMAQYNVDRLVTMGRSALYYEDYVLSIQYFNQAINAKPFLYEPWFFRGVAKYYLDDYVGAENDCSEAVSRNPYVTGIYELRGLCRIRQKKYDDAISDYDMSIKFDPANRGLWYNRVLCRIENKDFYKANTELDSMMVKWGDFSKVYSLKAEVCLLQEDTLGGGNYLDKSLEIDPYDADAWMVRAMISLSRKQWHDADRQLGKAIHLKPNIVGNYINRALARYNINNLRGAMADYDKAIEIDPENFMAHYNRGQLRVQVGDDNRAIADFDFIIQHEPQNFMAVFNRALLLDRTGDLRGAIRDYTTVINKFPNFWTGLHYRAQCYRRLGMTARAEQDEFRIFKAQNNKHFGIQQRWSKSKTREVRKLSEIDMDKYNQMVVADEPAVEHEYDSEYRGKVQNRKIDEQLMPMFMLAFGNRANGIRKYTAFDVELEKFNSLNDNGENMYLVCSRKSMSEEDAKRYFSLIDKLSEEIAAVNAMDTVRPLLLKRAAAYLQMQNFEDAVNDFTAYISSDSTSAMAFWQRAVCQSMMNDFNASQGVDVQLKAARTLDDFNKAASLNPSSAFLLYDRANFYVARKELERAIEEYTEAISIDPNLAEAYYNRGMTHLKNGNKKKGMADLSKAGELGLFDAYSVIRRFSEK
ncbi:tetratricopeptide repeat protein [Prevotella sp. OH937_COT-195]|uniref:tetratricopeptide repeat protein n=1 Tax=Prevotella sp. OH937_COT-195 TaxID=2491051 RepID=UPI000F64DA60|nr:tetratricopeptide repeat protein [Prevotella sp. OH937_COT-195]RRD02227.1 tetratricopeptide repeat protein [Prevotella sp. OH937_COT-195]